MKKFLKTFIIAILIIIIIGTVLAEFTARNNSHGLCGAQEGRYRNAITKEVRSTSSNCQPPFPAILWSRINPIF